MNGGVHGRQRCRDASKFTVVEACLSLSLCSLAQQTMAGQTTYLCKLLMNTACKAMYMTQKERHCHRGHAASALQTSQQFICVATGNDSQGQTDD
eukprot:m.21414 g.21414  ORF g.21414 m.21414 type:complete len:95 (+) comp8281_c0_seq1:31-315(+)